MILRCTQDDERRIVVTLSAAMHLYSNGNEALIYPTQNTKPLEIHQQTMYYYTDEAWPFGLQ